MPDCLFCGIASGEIPAKTVRESSRAIAFRDINPQAPTHVLVIPRDHYANLAEIAAAGDGLLDDLASLAAQVAADEGVAEGGNRVVLKTPPRCWAAGRGRGRRADRPAGMTTTDMK